MRHHVILRIVAKLLIPFIILFGLYVQFHGEYGPGGGFQAGVIIAAGIIWFALIYGLDTTRQAIPDKWVQGLMALGAVIFVGVGYICVAFGGRFLDYDHYFGMGQAAGQLYGIISVEVGVGITVTATMLVIFYTFAQRDP